MRSLTLVIFFAFVAIIGLILMFQTSYTGAGTFGIKEGRAIKMISEERFIKGGSPEGVPIGLYSRKGRIDYMGKEPCPEPKKYQLSPLFSGKQGCVPVKEEMKDYYLGSECCPIGTY